MHLSLQYPRWASSGQKNINCQLEVAMLLVEWWTDARALHRPYKLQSCIQTFKQVPECIGGIVDSIAASQAVDPGSIPGQCSRVPCVLLNQQSTGANYEILFRIFPFVADPEDTREKYSSTRSADPKYTRAIYCIYSKAGNLTVRSVGKCRHDWTRRFIIIADPRAQNSNPLTW